MEHEIQGHRELCIDKDMRLINNDHDLALKAVFCVIIPVFNILGVVCLSMFSDDGKPDIKKMLINIAKNPLILGVLSGLLVLGIRAIFVNYDVSFRLSDIEPIFKVLNYLSGAATPMALLALGAQFEFSAIPTLKKQIIFGSVLRCVIIPSVSLTIAYLLGIFNGAHFAAFVAMFNALDTFSHFFLK